MREPHPAIPVLTALVADMDRILARHGRRRESVSLRRGIVAAWMSQAQDALQLLRADPDADVQRQADGARQALRAELTATLQAVRIYESLLRDLHERLAARDHQGDHQGR
jgi:hypothetical protein